MEMKRGDRALLDHPVAQQLLQATIPARLSYIALDGTPPEMEAASTRYMGPEAGRAWVEQAARLSRQTVRIGIRPSWVDVLDFETRLPGGMVRRLAALTS